jgi:phosphoserine phosphatase
MSVQLPMGISERLTRHRLARCSATLRELRDELRISQEQCAVVSDDAADAELRAIVSETPAAQAEHREQQGHFMALARHIDHLQARIDDLEREQDELLDRLGRQNS